MGDDYDYYGDDDVIVEDRLVHISKVDQTPSPSS